MKYILMLVLKSTFCWFFHCMLQMGNKGAFIRFEAPDLKPNIVTFSAVVSTFYVWSMLCYIMFCHPQKITNMFFIDFIYDRAYLSICIVIWGWHTFLVSGLLCWICSHTLMSNLWLMQTTSSGCSHNLYSWLEEAQNCQWLMLFCNDCVMP